MYVCYIHLYCTNMYGMHHVTFVKLVHVRIVTYFGIEKKVPIKIMLKKEKLNKS